MIPANNDSLINDFTFSELPTRTHFLHITKDNISGFTDGIQAMAQAIYLILNTERYQHIIYSWNYGVELADLIGKPIAYVIPEAKRRITEALTQDTRITGVDSWTMDRAGNKLSARFTAHTIYGDIDSGTVVEI